MENTGMFANVLASEGYANDGHLQLDSDMFAYQHESFAPRSQAPASHLKLRSSCDACGQAKVRDQRPLLNCVTSGLRARTKTKCDRRRPACSRCVSQGIKCVYGVSRKSGKPPRRRPPVTSPSESEKRATNVDLMFGLAEGTLPITPDFSATDIGFQAQFPFGSLGDLSVLTPNLSDQDTTGLTWQCDSRATPKPAENSSTPNAVTGATAQRHSCAQELKDIMRVLYCSNPFTPVSDGVLARTLDLGSILTRSRDVVRRLELLLKCPCARSPHMAMLYASIMSRMLLWYRQAAWNATTTGASPTPAAEEPMPFVSGSSLTKAGAAETADEIGGGVSVLAMPVTVGTFETDDRNLQTALTNCLLLSELRKVGALIDMFMCIGRSELQNTNAACSIGEELGACQGDTALFESLGAWLWTEHGHILKKARSGLSVLHENIPGPSQ
ncbi:hypothetical protein F5B22DRAFT_115823 [Xylaria bambusicola]|uniref:uncharacterized protein n=1 Tax=Xylaria bambusicola TaxID=326684 RepID=UPI0020083DEA|nr:uncharacterized protein F5B22DRAFT_115823 [Xylaria bambusicola]KAI0517277.1 hypothetical protein F5B22DRAFT_115823 [Xylaria bambusicola]